MTRMDVITALPAGNVTHTSRSYLVVKMRIRSLHPTQWTDPEFLNCSYLARLLALALRNEADDNGIFPWKLGNLELLLLPRDKPNMDELMQELIDQKQIVFFESNGVKYGAIRNFHLFQSPKRPTYKHPLPLDSELVGYMFHTPPEQLPDNSRTTHPPTPPGKGKGKGKGNGNGEDNTYVQQVIEAWNLIAEPLNLRLARVCQKKRRSVATRMKETYFREHWLEGFTAVPDLPRWYLDKNVGREWTITLDFLLKDDESLSRIIEDARANNRQPAPTPGITVHTEDAYIGEDG